MKVEVDTSVFITPYVIRIENDTDHKLLAELLKSFEVYTPSRELHAFARSLINNIEHLQKK